MVDAQRRRSPKLRYLKAVSVAVAACFSVSVSTAYANPTGFAVVNGQVTFNYNGNTLSVTNTPGSIINWQGFSIGANELTRFIQQSAASSVLNRVVGADPSRILGALQSNGRVFLINPSGILFGAGAQVDVAGLVASTLNLSNADFLAGRFRFTEMPGAGSVVNQGSITTSAGGQVYLIAPNVQNSGIITSPRGEVILAAGRSVQLVDAGTPGLRVEVTAPDNEAVNVGQIMAASGKVGIYAGLIRAGGAIRADGVVAGENGEILLKATQSATVDAGATISASGAHGGKVTIQSGDTTLVSGTVEAKGSEAKGGTVQLLGHLVGVTGNAVVDASGQAGGGTVLVGGDYQGRNPDVQNAYRTYVGPSAAISADAIASGDGGKVIVWSDDATRVYGSISARGGAQSGDGGFVETSGHRLEVTRGPDVAAPRGAAGTWLLDPVDLAVVPGSGLANNTAAPFFDPLGETSSVGVDLINAQLDFGSNVILTTTSQGPADGAQAGNITISAPILKKAATTTGPGGLFIGSTSLTMQAHNNIVIDGAGSITSTGDPLSVTLTANFDGIGGGGVTVGGAIVTNGGSFEASGRDLIAINAPINTTRALGSAGSVTLNSTGGAVTVSQSVSGGFFAATASGGNALTLASSVTGTGATLTADDMEIQAALNAGSGAITVRQNLAGRPIDLGTNTPGSLSLTQTELSNLVTSGTKTFGNGSTGPITVSAPLSVGSSSVSLQSGSSFTVNAGASLTTAVPLFLTAPTMAINSTVSASEINVSTGSFGQPVNLGNGAGGGLQLDAAELANLSSNMLRISGFGGAMTVQGPISRSGTLSLSGSTLGQSIGVGATIAADNLRLNFSSVNLPEANAVVTLAGSVSNLTLSNSSLLTIGSVDGTNGMFTSTATLKTDDLNVASTFSGNTINIMPLTPGRTLNLGGADVGGQLNISAADLGNIRGTTVNLGADTANIDGPVSASTSTSLLTIAPVTANRPLNIVGAKVGGALEFTPADIGNVTANSFTLGDDTITGPVAVNTPVTVPATVELFTLRTGHPSGITVGAGNTVAARSIALIADAMAINDTVTATVGELTVVPNTPGTSIGLGAGAGTLSLDAAEAGRLHAAGTLFIGDSNAGGVTITGPVIFSGIGALNITSGGTITESGGLTTPGNLFLTASDMAISAAVTASGDINVAPVGGTVTLGGPGGGLNLSDAEVDFFAPGSGVLRIGDINAGNIQITGAISPANATTLSLKSDGSVTQTALSTITVANLAVDASGDITLDQDNAAATVALRSRFGEVNYTHSGFSLVTIGNVDDLSGIQGGAFIFGGRPVTVLSDEINISSGISGSSVTLAPRNSDGATDIDIGTKVIGKHSFTQTELDRISAQSVTIGDGNSGNLVVSAPVSISTFSDLTLITGGSINTAATLTNTVRNITMFADSMTFGAGVSALSGTITLAPVNALTNMDLGGADVLSTKLGLDATDLGHLSAAAFAFGSGTTPSITVSAATSLGATPTTLSTQGAGTGTINVNAPLTSGDLTLMTDNLVIPGGGSVTAPNVSLNPVSGGRTLDLGTAITGTALGLDQAQLDRISTAGLSFDFFGSINVSNAVSFNSANLTLLGDTMTIGNTVTNNAGGRIIVAPASNFRAMNLGTNPAAGALGLTPLEITRFITTGVLQLGEAAINTGSIVISESIAPASGVSALVLAANGSITQSAGKIITASNLGIDSFGSVNLTENNSVGTLAGSSSSSFTFTGAGALNIGTVDGRTGISDSTVTIKADTLTLAQPISGSNVTLAPRNAGAPIDLGSKPAGVFGITDAEMDLISASSLTFGNSTAGPVNVSSAMSRASGTLNIVTGAAQSVSVNAGLSGQSNVSVTGGTINIGAPLSSTFGSVTLNALAPTTLNVNAAVTARFSVTMTSDVINVGAPVTSTFGDVTFQPQTSNRPIDLGSENASALSITAAEVNQVTASSLIIGNTSAGPLTVTAPIAPAGVTNLSLRSGGAITQNPGATIVTRKVVNDDVQGSLEVIARDGVDLREANDVGERLSGNAFGTKSDFFFNNVGPLKLPSGVSVSFTGKRRINAGLFEAPIPASQFDESLQNSVIVGLDRSTDFSAFDKDKDKKKDEEKKSDEKQINKGLNAMCKP